MARRRRATFCRSRFRSCGTPCRFRFRWRSGCNGKSDGFSRCFFRRGIRFGCTTFGGLTPRFRNCFTRLLWGYTLRACTYTCCGGTSTTRAGLSNCSSGARYRSRCKTRWFVGTSGRGSRTTGGGATYFCRFPTCLGACRGAGCSVPFWFGWATAGRTASGTTTQCRTCCFARGTFTFGGTSRTTLFRWRGRYKNFVRVLPTARRFTRYGTIGATFGAAWLGYRSVGLLGKNEVGKSPTEGKGVRFP